MQNSCDRRIVIPREIEAFCRTILRPLHGIPSTALRSARDETDPYPPTFSTAKVRLPFRSR